MALAFQIVQSEEQGRQVGLGIEVGMGSEKVVVPITKRHSTYEALTSEVEAIRENLRIALDDASLFLEGRGGIRGSGISPDLPPEKIWSALSAMASDEAFVAEFNNLPEGARAQVAEYVLSQCNVFSGKAAVFSSRYNDSSKSLDQT